MLSEAGFSETTITALSAKELLLFQLYQLATWVTFSALDDPAMLAFAFS
jgi:hypothetical protein